MDQISPDGYYKNPKNLHKIQELKELSSILEDGGFSKPYDIGDNSNRNRRLDPDEIIDYIGNKLTEQEIKRLRLNLQTRKNEDLLKHKREELSEMINTQNNKLKDYYNPDYYKSPEKANYYNDYDEYNNYDGINGDNEETDLDQYYPHSGYKPTNKKYGDTSGYNNKNYGDTSGYKYRDNYDNTGEYQDSEFKKWGFIPSHDNQEVNTFNPISQRNQKRTTSKTKSTRAPRRDNENNNNQSNTGNYYQNHELTEMEVKVRLEMTEDQLELLKRRMESKEEQWNMEKRTWEKEKIELMARIVDLEDFEQRSNDYRRRAEKLEGELGIWKEKELKLRRNEVNDLLLGIQKDSDWKKKCEELEVQNYRLKDNLKTLESDYSQARIRRDELELNIKEYENRIQESEKEKVIIKNKLNDEFNLLQKRFAKEVTDRKRQIDSLTIEKESLRKEFETYKASNHLNDDLKGELNSRIESLNKQLTDLEQRNSELLNKLMGENRKVLELESLKTDLDMEKDSYGNQIKLLKSRLNDYDQDKDTMVRLQNKVKEEVTLGEMYQKERDAYAEKIRSLNEKMDELKNENNLHKITSHTAEINKQRAENENEHLKQRVDQRDKEVTATKERQEVEIARLEDKLKRAIQERENITQQYEGLTTKNKNHQKGFSNEIDVWREENKRLKDEKTRLESDLNQSNITINDLQKKYKEVNELINQMQSRNEDREVKISELRKEKEALNNHLWEVKKELQGYYDGINVHDDSKRIQGDYERLRLEVVQKSEKIANLQEEINSQRHDKAIQPSKAQEERDRLAEAYKKEIEIHKSDKNNLSDQNNKLKADNENLNRKLNDLLGKLEDMQLNGSNLKLAEGDVSDLRRKLKAKERENELLRIDIEAIKNRNNDLDSAIINANAKFNDLSSKNKDLRRTVTDLESVTKSHSEFGDQNNDKLNQQIKRLKDKNKLLDSENKAMLEEMEKLQKKINNDRTNKIKK